MHPGPGIQHGRFEPHHARLRLADRTLFLAGSSGLELLYNLDLPNADLARIHVFAYGPVARRLPACDACFVQGRDLISRLFFRAGSAGRVVRVAGLRLTTMQAARLVPVAGQLVAAGIGYWSVNMVAMRHIADCERIVAELGDGREYP